ncbi:MAG: DUF6776 family protein [Pseudomonadota bacterium]
MSHEIVRARPPWQRWLVRLLILLSVIAGAWALYQYGRYQGGYDAQQVDEQLQAQRQQLEQMEVENSRLRAQQAILERSAQIEQKAYNELEGEISGLQDEMLELKQELAFYRGIVSPEDAKKGLNLQRFELTPGSTGRSYYYKLVLTQVLNNGEVTYGNVAVSIIGTQEGEEQELKLEQISERESEPGFRFRYFQAFEGELFLPEGFKPSKVKLVVKPRSKKHKQLTETIDWVVQES